MVVAIFAVVVVTIVVLLLSGWRPRYGGSPPLGTMSQQWVAEYRMSHSG